MFRRRQVNGLNVYTFNIFHSNDIKQNADTNILANEFIPIQYQTSGKQSLKKLPNAMKNPQNQRRKNKFKHEPNQTKPKLGSLVWYFSGLSRLTKKLFSQK